jgi:hypothetical protein
MDKSTFPVKTLHRYNYNDTFSVNEDIDTDYQIRLSCISVAEKYSKTVIGVLNNAELIYRFLSKKIE